MQTKYWMEIESHELRRTMRLYFKSAVYLEDAIAVMHLGLCPGWSIRALCPEFN